MNNLLCLKCLNVARIYYISQYQRKWTKVDKIDVNSKHSHICQGSWIRKSRHAYRDHIHLYGFVYRSIFISNLTSNEMSNILKINICIYFYNLFVIVYILYSWYFMWHGSFLYKAAQFRDVCSSNTLSGFLSFNRWIRYHKYTPWNLSKAAWPIWRPCRTLDWILKRGH